MKTNRFAEGKKELQEEFGKAYPTCRKELTAKFLMKFGNYTQGVDEDNFEDVSEYEDAKYSSEKWDYYCKLSDAVIALNEAGDEGKFAWENYIDWIVDNYFPEFA